DADELDDDVQDRTRGQREEHDRHLVAGDRLADGGADEGRAAADETEQAEQPPARRVLLAGERADDAEALSGVVQAETDEEQDGEAERAGGGGLADGEAFGEVVQADADGDGEREPGGRGPLRPGP